MQPRWAARFWWLCAGIVLALPVLAVDNVPALPDAQLQQRYYSLTHELRCMQCQNESLADSPVGLAADLRLQVRELLLAGQSDDQIRDHMVARYGEFILFRPRMSWRNAWLWSAPVVLMLVGLIVAWRVIRSRSRLVRDDEADPNVDVAWRMSAFTFLAILLALLAGLAVAWPLLRARSDAPSAPIAAMISVLAVIAGSALLYSRLGSPSSAHTQTTGDSNRTVAALARHLESKPQDRAGWLALGSAYVEIGQFALAIRADERANRLADNKDPEALLGIGEAMMLSGDETLGAQAPQYVERALQLEPQSPKALFYGAVIAYHQDQLQLARDRFSALLALSPPDNVRVAVQKEIDDIDTKLHPKIDEATAIHLHVTLAASLAAKLPANASLFVFVPSPTGGPPLAVKRNAATLPQDVALSAADSMIAGRGIQAGQKVSVIARISASGSPLPTSGDLFGQIDYVVGKSGARSLEIDKLNP